MTDEHKEIMDALKFLNDKIDHLLLRGGPIQETCIHDYPVVWHGAAPPICSKCGKPDLMFNTTWTK